jgi:formylglycine-generating enzyme required for sulfatase activity
MNGCWTGSSLNITGIYSGEVNPQGPKTGELKVFRGGSWNEDPEVARSAGRNAAPPDRQRYLPGFRCATSEAAR